MLDLLWWLVLVALGITVIVLCAVGVVFMFKELMPMLTELREEYEKFKRAGGK